MGAGLPRSECFVEFEEQAPLIRRKSEIKAKTHEAIGRQAEAQSEAAGASERSRSAERIDPHRSDVAESDGRKGPRYRRSDLGRARDVVVTAEAIGVVAAQEIAAAQREIGDVGVIAGRTASLGAKGEHEVGCAYG